MKQETSRPLPLFARFLLNRMTLYKDRHSVLEDFEETFNEIRETKGIFKARLWCYLNILKSLPVYFIFMIKWNAIMIGNYAKIAGRTIKRQKGYSFINTFCLSIGFAGCILMFAWVSHELSFDRFHEHADELYRITTKTYSVNGSVHSARSAPAVGTELVR